jgi:hypothetical protein
LAGCAILPPEEERETWSDGRGWQGLWRIEFNYAPTPTGSPANPTSFDYWIDDLEFW